LPDDPDSFQRPVAGSLPHYGYAKEGEGYLVMSRLKGTETNARFS